MGAHHPIARFEDSDTITLLLDKYVGPGGRPMTLRELARTFAITVREIVDALSLPDNYEFARALYQQLHDAGAADSLFPEESIPPLEELDPMYSGDANREFVFEWVGQCYERGFDFDPLEVPQLELELPSSPELLALVVRMYGRGPRADRIIQIDVINFPKEEVARLESATKALQDAIALGKNRFEPFAPTVVALDKFAFACDLQRRHWWSEWRKKRLSKEEYERHAERLVPAVVKARELRDRVMESVPDDQRELECAARVLTFFDPDERAQLHQFLLEFAEYPKLFEPADVARFISALEVAIDTLCLSSRAEEFFRDDLLRFFDVAAMSPGGEFEDALRAVSDSMASDCSENWRKPLEAAREVLGPPKRRTLLEDFNLFMKAERTARNLVATALNPAFQHTFLRILFSSSYRVTWTIPHHFGAFVLRQVAVNFTLMRGTGLELQNAKRGTFLKLMKTLETLSQAKKPEQAGEAKKAIEGLTDLKLGTSFTRSRVAISLNFVGYTLAFMYACASAPSSNDSVSAHVKFVASLGSAFAGVGQQLYRRHELTAFLIGDAKLTENVGGIVRRFGAAANLLAAVASTISAAQKFAKGKTLPASFDTAAALGSALIGTAQILELFASTAGVAAWCAGFGYVLTAVAIVGLIVYDALNDGVEPILDGLRDFIADERPMLWQPDWKRQLDNVLLAARDSLSSLRIFAGRRDINAYSGTPTIWSAHILGFANAEIVIMFDSTAAYVETILVGAEVEAAEA